MPSFAKSLPKFLFVMILGISWNGFAEMANGLYYQRMGKGAPIIVLHGGPGLDQTYLQPQLFKLAESHEVIFYDQRGSGKSLHLPHDATCINMAQFVEDLESLRKSLGIERFILLGHSWGALLAMQYAICHQEHLDGLILLNSSPANAKGQQAFTEEFKRRTKNLPIQPLFNFEEFKQLNAKEITGLYRLLFTVYCYRPEKANDLNLPFHVESAQSGHKVMIEMGKMLQNIDLFPGLKTLTIPTLVMTGKEDITPAWTSTQIKEAIPQAELVILEECGHFPYVEQPVPFFNALNHFLGPHE